MEKGKKRVKSLCVILTTLMWFGMIVFGCIFGDGIHIDGNSHNILMKIIAFYFMVCLVYGCYEINDVIFVGLYNMVKRENKNIQNITPDKKDGE